MPLNRLRPSSPSLHPPVPHGLGWGSWRSLRHLTLGLLASGLAIAIAPVQAADYLYINLGLLERSISSPS